jgi:large repetitive protein
MRRVQRELYDRSTRTLIATGNMTTARAGQTATLLKNGRVLIAGGDGSDGKPSTSAELYDPLTGTFSPAGNMISSRSHHTATLLKHATVLVAGGIADSSLVSAEIYNPSTETFSITGDMIRTRPGYHTATLLNDGRVLIAGGHSGFGSGLRIAELYDPSTGTFSRTGDMTRFRQEHTATLLNDGTVLIAGGVDDTSPWSFNSSSRARAHIGTIRGIAAATTARLSRFIKIRCRSPHLGVDSNNSSPFQLAVP